MHERFTPDDIQAMMPDAMKNETYHRARTDGEASENTREIFAQQETQRAIDEAHPDNPLPHEIKEAANETKAQERARDAIAKIRALLQEQEPERPDYDHPPTSR